MNSLSSFSLPTSSGFAAISPWWWLAIPIVALLSLFSFLVRVRHKPATSHWNKAVLTPITSPVWSTVEIEGMRRPPLLPPPLRVRLSHPSVARHLPRRQMRPFHWQSQ